MADDLSIVAAAHHIIGGTATFIGDDATISGMCVLATIIVRQPFRDLLKFVELVADTKDLLLL